jgi:hypothetical protein
VLKPTFPIANQLQVEPGKPTTMRAVIFYQREQLCESSDQLCIATRRYPDPYYGNRSFGTNFSHLA